MPQMDIDIRAIQPVRVGYSQRGDHFAQHVKRWRQQQVKIQRLRRHLPDQQNRRYPGGTAQQPAGPHTAVAASDMALKILLRPPERPVRRRLCLRSDDPLDRVHDFCRR
jgi:hypothetical protein